jgi:hypothetical protein
VWHAVYVTPFAQLFYRSSSRMHGMSAGLGLFVCVLS